MAAVGQEIYFYLFLLLCGCGRIDHPKVFQTRQLAFLYFKILITHLREKGRKDRLNGKRTVKCRMIVIFYDYPIKVLDSSQKGTQAILKLGKFKSKLLDNPFFIIGIGDN